RSDVRTSRNSLARRWRARGRPSRLFLIGRLGFPTDVLAGFDARHSRSGELSPALQVEPRRRHRGICRACCGYGAFMVRGLELSRIESKANNNTAREKELAPLYSVSLLTFRATQRGLTPNTRRILFRCA